MEACAIQQSVATSDWEDRQYEQLLKSIRNQFRRFTAPARPLFRTSAEGLMDVFLDGLSPGRRQRYTCHECRHFLERYGNLVVIEADGTPSTVMWEDPGYIEPGFFDRSINACRLAVLRAPVTSVFLSDLKVWGQPVTGEWHHMAVYPDARLLTSRKPLLTLGQMEAEKSEDFKTLKRGLEEFNIETLKQAVAILKTDQLYRSEKCLDVAKWLLSLQDGRCSTKNERGRDNMVWLAVAGAPPGWCHPRTTMIGTLLEDIENGLDFDEVKRRFAEKMHPLQYQRPTAAPSDGQIAAAEKVVAELGVAGALARRFAKLEDLKLLWTPNLPVKPASGSGVFGHLRASVKKEASDLGTAPMVTTWVKFARDILSTAEQIEFLVPSYFANYTAYVTAANPDAPNMLQWPHPVSWYMRVHGSAAAAWGLRPGDWIECAGACLAPPMWGDKPLAQHGEHVTFILRGAWDHEYEQGAGFFPEILKSEYHGIRSTLEAHMSQAVIQDRESAAACGICLQKGAKWGWTFRVTSGGFRTQYLLDRWE
jgi:hypothetical protein